MFEFLILVLAVCVTFLVTDFRRWLEIKSIKADHKAEMDQTFDYAWDSGYEAGYMLGEIETKAKNNHRHFV